MIAKGIGRQFASFVGVGALGFTIDAVLFLAAHQLLSWPVYPSRGVSALCSITTTWILNRHTTFADFKSENKKAEYSRYLSSQLVGLVINLGTFAGLITFVPLMRSYPFAALSVGAAAAIVVNFVTARAYAFGATSSRIMPRSAPTTPASTHPAFSCDSPMQAPPERLPKAKV